MDAFNSVLMNNQGGVDEQNGESGNGSLSLDGLESSNNNSTSSSGSGGSSASFPARYRCACGKLFQKLCGLKSHIKVHQAQGARLSVNDAGELEWLTESGMPVIAKAEEVCRNHVCDICSRSFLRKQDLRRHKSTHLSVSKRFKCENCDTTFSRSDALFRHTKSMRCRE